MWCCSLRYLLASFSRQSGKSGVQKGPRRSLLSDVGNRVSTSQSTTFMGEARVWVVFALDETPLP
jgi:hypothetical protein